LVSSRSPPCHALYSFLDQLAADRLLKRGKIAVTRHGAGLNWVKVRGLKIAEIG
jgi:hypothetical protein